MAKKAKKLLKKIAKYGAVFVAGAAIVGALWWKTYVPPTARAVAFVGGAYIIDTGQARILNYDLERVLIEGQAYLYEPLYIFNRQRGIDILTQAADLGSLDAIGILQMYYLKQMQSSKSIANENEFVRWRHAMAKAGDPRGVTHFFTAPLPPMTAEEEALVEVYGRNYKDIAAALADYYAGKHGVDRQNPQKAEYWYNLLQTEAGFMDAPQQPDIRQYHYRLR